jgi:hypothetical protein
MPKTAIVRSREKHNNQWVSAAPSKLQTYWLGTKVWLDTTHLKIVGTNPKLQPKQYGPFKIMEVSSPVAYRLGLPSSWTIHNIFHVSLLHPYTETHEHGSNYTWPPPNLIDRDEKYKVERIINHRRYRREKTLQYLIK